MVYKTDREHGLQFLDSRRLNRMLQTPSESDEMDG